MEKLERVLKTGLYLIFAVFSVLVSLCGVAMMAQDSVRMVLYFVVSLALLLGAAVAACLYLKRHPIEKPIFWLAAICVLGILVRVVAVQGIQPAPASDFETYHQVAAALAEGTIVKADYIAKYPHVIGYPAFLSLFYRLFGASVVVGQYVNILLCGGIMVELYFLGKRVADKSVGLLGALLFALLPSMVLYCTLLASEMLFTVLFLGCVLLLLEAIKRKGCAAVLLGLAAGLLLAVTNAVRPLGPLVLIAFFLYAWLFGKNLVRWKAAVSVVLLAAYVLTGMGLTASVARVIGEDIQTSATGYTLYVGTNLESGGTWNEADALKSDAVFAAAGGDEKRWNDQMTDLALERLQGYSMPQLVLLMGKKFSNLWGTNDHVNWYIKSALPAEDAYHGYYEPLRTLTNLGYYAVLLLVVFGLRALRKSRELPFLALLVLGAACMYMLTEVAGRYTYSTTVLLLLFSAAGLLHCGMGIQKQLQKKRAAFRR